MQTKTQKRIKAYNAILWRLRDDLLRYYANGARPIEDWKKMLGRIEEAKKLEEKLGNDAITTFFVVFPHADLFGAGNAYTGIK